MYVQSISNRYIYKLLQNLDVRIYHTMLLWHERKFRTQYTRTFTTQCCYDVSVSATYLFIQCQAPLFSCSKEIVPELLGQR